MKKLLLLLFLTSLIYSQTIGVLGTSLCVTGWENKESWIYELQHRLQDNFPKIKFFNFAKGGEQSRYARKMLNKCVNVKPDIVLFESSINDAYANIDEHYSGVSLNNSQENLNVIIDSLQQAGAIVIVMTMNPPFDSTISGRNPFAQRPFYRVYNSLYKETARLKNCVFIDLTSEWDKLSKEEFLSYCPDGLHPNEKGSSAITIPIVAKVITDILHKKYENIKLVKKSH